MKRRKFVSTAVAASAAPFMISASLPQSFDPSQKEVYEIRTYEIKFRANRQLLLDYLQDALLPGLLKQGANHFMIMEEIGMTDPAKLWVVISYTSGEGYFRSQNLYSDSNFLRAASSYNSLGPDQTLYNRFGSSLLLAFDGMPELRKPLEGAGLFELRTYEGYNEDAVKRKIKMFNEGEIQLFLDTGLFPVFFGEMLIGPSRPCLTYMLNFKDMEQRDANWKQFIDHPGWKELSAMPEYANTVSNIQRTFLKPLGPG